MENQKEVKNAGGRKAGTGQPLLCEVDSVKERIDYWQCQKCGYDSAKNMNDEYYYFNGEKLVECTTMINNRIVAKPPKGKDAYPKIENYESNRFASFEYGVNGHDWTEIHFCPNCREEYSFENSDF